MYIFTQIQKLSRFALIGALAAAITACGGGYDVPEVNPTPVVTPTAAPEPTPLPDAPEDNNLLSNSELEYGNGNDFSNWTVLNGSDNVTAITEDTCFGRGIQAVATGGNYWDVQISADAVDTTVGLNYTASMWIKGSVADGTIRFSTAGSNALYQGDQTIGTDWQQVVWTFTANETSTTLVLDLGVSDVTYNIDDIKLVEGNEPDLATCPKSDLSGNWLYNGGLDFGNENEFPGWGVWNGADNVTAVMGEGCFGRALQAVSAGGNYWDVQVGGTAVPTVEDTNYTASMWIKGSVADGIVRFSTSGSNAQYQGDQTIGTDWQEVTWTFTANEAATTLVLDLGVSAVTYTIDDIRLVEGDTPIESSCPRAGDDGNLLYNGGLELGVDNDFSGWGKWNGGDNITATTDEVYSGARALQAVASGGNYWDVQVGGLSAATVPDTSYTASAWMKSDTADAVFRFSTSGDNAQYQGDQLLGTDWQQVTWTFTANETGTVLVLDMGAATGTIYIDELSLVEAE